ncbi:hypothetical protein [Paraburkholderia nodosa]|uniref:hypothetical protein n=1 Tax=Paraburkholderia nodosa TaxID=392320 RepID=UPI000841B2F0|nr:hypothetical protein [Paraburkholderia nodosa]
MANNTSKPLGPPNFVDITISLTGDENKLISAAISRVNEAGLLCDFMGHAGPGLTMGIFNKIAVASAEQWDPYAQALCLQAGLPFGGGAGTVQ